MKETTHKLMTLDFWCICISNFCLYAAIWTLLPILPAEGYLMGMNRTDITVSFLLFIFTLIGVGPLHCYLGDAFKRKHVLILGTLATALCMAGWFRVNEPWQVMGLMALAGASFGIATTAGITIAIDITQSNRRGAGNRMYAFSGALGMLLGICCLSSFYITIGFNSLVFVSLALFAISLLMETGIYVAFRAPVGVGIFNIDRFFLPLAWLPAVNVLLLTFGIGLLMNVLPPYTYLRSVVLIALTIASVPLTRMFVKLSHHCQRGTANTTLQLASQAGLLLGTVMGEWISNNVIISGMIIVSSAFMFMGITLPYFRRNRVRP